MDSYYVLTKYKTGHLPINGVLSYVAFLHRSCGLWSRTLEFFHHSIGIARHNERKLPVAFGIFFQVFSLMQLPYILGGVLAILLWLAVPYQDVLADNALWLLFVVCAFVLSYLPYYDIKIPRVAHNCQEVNYGT